MRFPFESKLLNYVTSWYQIQDKPRSGQRRFHGAHTARIAASCGIRTQKRPQGTSPLRAFSAFGCRKMLRFSLYALRVISPGASDGFLCAVGWSEAGFLSLCAASRFGFLLVTESAYVDYNLKAIYSSLAQCGCRGLCESLILARTFGACKV